jgi:hypothetical protein
MGDGAVVPIVGDASGCEEARDELLGGWLSVQRLVDGIIDLLG